MSNFPEMDYKPITTEELIDLAPDETSLDFLRKVYRSVKQLMNRRMRAAIEGSVQSFSHIWFGLSGARH